MEAQFIDLLADLDRILLAYIRSTPWEILVLQAFLLIAIYYSLNGIELMLRMRFVSRRNMMFSRMAEGGMSILIAGDSTAVGTGAKRPESTIAGLLAQDFPQTSIVNVAVNGARTKGIMKQFEKVRGSEFDMVLLSTGGNDVWSYTRIKKLGKHLRAVLTEAKELSGHRVIVLFFGNEGSAPFFPRPLRGFLMNRTRRVKDLFAEITNEERVPLIELFTSEDENPFVVDPKRFFAADGLHPSDAGYWEWYKRLWRLMIENGYLYSEESRKANEIATRN